MSRKASPATDPLLAALIAKLPASDTAWPVDRQLAWLKMMAMAFATVYGGDVLSQMGNVQEAAPMPPAKPVAPPAPPPPPTPQIKHKFVIDADGYMRHVNGKRILPGDVTGEVLDLSNGAVDLRNIIWADESVGLNGKDLTIVVG